MNQNPEQIARDTIDKKLKLAGWLVQSKDEVNLSAGIGIALRETNTESGSADYILFVNSKDVGVIEAKAEDLLPHLRHLQTQIDLLTRSGQDPKKLQKDQMTCESYDLILKDKVDQQIEFKQEDCVTDNYKLFDAVVGQLK